jgi:hypothetical protein
VLEKKEKDKIKKSFVNGLNKEKYYMEKQALKDLLKSIDSNDYQVPAGLTPYELSSAMLDNIGDTDSELRDELILSILSKWIIDGILSTNEVYQLFTTMLDGDYILKGLGDMNDSVFCRTFSVELLASIIYRHRQEHFISRSDIEKALNTVLKFYNEDMDVRGYVNGKGWAHGAAHGADALDEFARCDEIGQEGLRKILNAIYNKVNVKQYGYIHFEDERMVTAVKAILERNIIPAKEVEAWIRGFIKMAKTGVHQEDQVIEFNVNSFLKSLYFRLIDRPEYEQLTNVVKEVLKQINRYSEC